MTLTDTLPAGLTVSGTLSQSSWDCDVSATLITCTNNTVVEPFQSFPVLELTVSVAEDAPCTVTTRSRSRVEGAPRPRTPTHEHHRGDCDDDNGGGGGGGESILPINLNGVIPLFNNISTNSNIDSPAAGNTGRQVFGLNAP